MQSRFNRFTALWASFYSRDLYRQVVYGWKGIGALHLLLLLGLCWLPSAVRWSAGLRAFAAADARVVINQLPSVSIHAGVMTATPSGRHVISLGGSGGAEGEAALIIDDSIDEVPSDMSATAFVLTRREAGTVRPSRSERRVWALTSATEMDVTPEDAQSFVNAFAFWAAPVGYVAAVAGALIFRLLQVLLYGAAVLAYARRQFVSLDYYGAVRLAAVAITPVVVIRTLIWFGPWEPAWYWRWPVAILITAAYIAFGVRALAAAAPAEDQRQVDASC